MASREQLRKLVVGVGLVIAAALACCYLLLSQNSVIYRSEFKGTLLSFITTEPIAIEPVHRYEYTASYADEQYRLRLIPRLSQVDLNSDEIVVAETSRYVLSGPKTFQDILILPQQLKETFLQGEITEIADFTPVNFTYLARASTGGLKVNDEMSQLEMVAVERGYRQVSEADQGIMVATSNGVVLNDLAAESFKSFKASLEEVTGIELVAASGFRSVADQQQIFEGRLLAACLNANPACSVDSPSAQVLGSVMDMAAPPGFSRHHSGLAVDVVEGFDGRIEQFASTESYRMISADNFRFARSFGFIPSYPEGADNQGPEPEAWEFIYVGQSFAL